MYRPRDSRQYVHRADDEALIHPLKWRYPFGDAVYSAPPASRAPVPSGKNPPSDQHLQPLLTPPPTSRRQRLEDLSKLIVTVRLGLISATGPAKLHDRTRVPFTHLIITHHIAHRASPGSGPYQFFDKTSFNAALSNNSSATNRFNRRFSSSKAFSRWASLTDIP